MRGNNKEEGRRSGKGKEERMFGEKREEGGR